MRMVVADVVSGSPGALAGIRPGDTVLRLNGRDDLEDMFDYQFEVTDEAYLEWAIRHNDGTEEIVRMEKDPATEPGVRFESPIFTPIKVCNNACPFCFIDQQPDGLRPTLYVKDDDYRLSYFNGTYITMTNLTPRDRERIERLRPGPLYVSVQSTIPEVRCELLQNKKAGNIMDELRWLKRLEIPFHCQIVLCPGINDGDKLTRALQDLASLRPEASSVAVVPVGLTQYRNDLFPLNPVTETIALDTIHRVDAIQQQTHQDFVFLSDEFYFKAGLPLPDYGHYGDFPQLSNGVGTVRLLQQEFFQLEPTLPQSMTPASNQLVLTGKLAAMALQSIINRMNAIQGLYLDVVAVENNFWGDSVSVAGLVTGQDIVNTLKHQDLSRYTQAIIPSVMLKADQDEFLDGMRLDDLSAQLGLTIRVVRDPYSAKEFIDTVLITAAVAQIG